MRESLGAVVPLEQFIFKDNLRPLKVKNFWPVPWIEPKPLAESSSFTDPSALKWMPYVLLKDVIHTVPSSIGSMLTLFQSEPKLLANWISLTEVVCLFLMVKTSNRSMGTILIALVAIIYNLPSSGVPHAPNPWYGLRLGDMFLLSIQLLRLSLNRYIGALLALLQQYILVFWVLLLGQLIATTELPIRVIPNSAA